VNVAQPPRQVTQHLLADQVLPQPCRRAHPELRDDRPVRGDHPDQPGQARKAGCQLLYVTNSTIQGVTAYTLDGVGNVLQADTIIGSSTGLNNPDAVAVDAAANIYVTNFGAVSTPATASITIYAPGASGDATPTATIAGSNTGLSTPQGIAVDAAGTIYVANDFIGGPASRITVYAPGARRTGSRHPSRGSKALMRDCLLPRASRWTPPTTSTSPASAAVLLFRPASGCSLQGPTSTPRRR